MVTLDAITFGEGVPKKKRFQSWEKVAQSTNLDRHAMNQLWLFSSRAAVFIELVFFGGSQDYRGHLEARLDRGLTPFRIVERYETREGLLASLAFRPDVQGLIDVPTKSWQWGARGMSLSAISRL
jgi:hypothetical protein